MNNDNPHHQRIPPDTQPSQAQLTHEDELQYPPDIVGDTPSPFPSISSPHSSPRPQADELTLYYNSDNELSDFPPIRVGDAPPLFPPLTPPVSRYHLRPRPPVAPRRLLQESPTRGKGQPEVYRRLNPDKGLGSTNVLNTVDQAVPVQQAKSTSKRGSGIRGAANERLLKKQRIALSGESDMESVRQEIAGLKTVVEQLATESRNNNNILQELLREIRRK